jgi:hypothetical protein
MVSVGNSIPRHFWKSPQGSFPRTRGIGEALAFVIRGAEVAIVCIDKEAGHG